MGRGMQGAGIHTGHLPLWQVPDADLLIMSDREGSHGKATREIFRRLFASQSYYPCKTRCMICGKVDEQNGLRSHVNKYHPEVMP